MKNVNGNRFQCNLGSCTSLVSIAYTVFIEGDFRNTVGNFFVSKFESEHTELTMTRKFLSNCLSKTSFRFTNLTWAKKWQTFRARALRNLKPKRYTSLSDFYCIKTIERDWDPVFSHWYQTNSMNIKAVLKIV